MPCLLTEIKVVHEEGIDVVEQSHLVGEIAVEIDFREQQGKILVVFPYDLLRPMFINLFRIFHDMPVIFQQLLLAYTIIRIKMSLQRINHT